MKSHSLCACVIVAFMVALPARAGGECSAAPDAARSEAAERVLTGLGADIQVREAGKQRKVMLTTDGSWRGGDEGLAHLKDIAGLYKLRLAGPITDAGLVHLADVCELTSLDLHIVGVTDVGVAELGRVKRLQRLNLTYTKVTDAGLDALAGLRDLKWLGLSYTRVTLAGIDRLRLSLSDTIIEGNPSR